MRKTIGTIVITGASALVIAACGSSSNSSGSGSGSTGSANTIVGAGSTLIAPLMSAWQPTYDTATNVAITYGAIGSGAGIEQITARTVDFGASDAPLTSDQFTAAKGVVQIPWALAGTAVAYHVSGVPNQLKLTGPVIAEMFQGQITSWNDPQIAKLNPGVKLPSTKVTPVYRTDGSGDTYAFTNYLSHVSPTFKSKIGVSTQVSWPTGVGGKGNSGVGGVLSTTDGAIGYVAISYVLANKFDYALVQNAAGQYPVPGPASFEAAAKSLTTIPSDNNVSIVDPPASAAGAYPISTFTYAIVPLSSPKAKTLKPFLTWAITEGQADGAKLDFAPLPAKVVAVDKTTIAKIK